MRRLMLAAVMVGIAHGALAADLPDLPVLRGFMNDAPRTTRTNWQGFYAGGQGGFSAVRMNFARTNADLVSSFSANMNQFFSGSPVMPPGFPALGNATSSAVGFGGFVGYNAQWDDAVIGVEANYSHTELKGSFAGSTQLSGVLGSGGYFYQGFSDSNASLVVRDFGTLRIRGGWSVGSFMPYAFAGVALGRGDVVRNVTGQVTRVPIPGQPQSPNAFPPLGPITAHDSITNRLLYGYSAGLGTEICLFGGLFARAEYEYVRLTSNVDVNISTIRGGIGYKF